MAMMFFPGLLQSQNLTSTGMIYNSGKIIIQGNAVIVQDTIDGAVIYERHLGGEQQVPSLVYKDIEFRGKAPKNLYEKNRDFISRNIFFSDEEAEVKIDRDQYVYTEGLTEHHGFINKLYIYGRVKMDGINPQDVTGKGMFRELELENISGADVVRDGGFRISTIFEMSAGDMRNNTSNNFIMKDTSWIIRHSGTNLTSEPIFESRVNVRYLGTDHMTQTGELPSDPTVLQNMMVENTGGLTLINNVTVNDTLLMKSSVYTEPSPAEQYVLTKTSGQDPIFADINAEIDGSFKRTKLYYDNRQMLFNNAYTYAAFDGDASANGIASMQMRIKPLTFPVQPQGDEKVKRLIDVYAWDGSENPVLNGIMMEMGYAWRDNPSDIDTNESNGLNVPDLILQRWERNSNDWVNNVDSRVPTNDPSSSWTYSHTTLVTQLGSFAIGQSITIDLVFLAKVILEGAFRYSTKEMATDLNQRDLIPTTPPDIYPYNLDPLRTLYSVNQIPASVVDWIIVEFRSASDQSKRTYRTCFLKYDGTLVDVDGFSQVIVSPSTAGIDSGGGEYYVAIRHRNHIAVISENPLSIYPETMETIYDFTDPSLLMGQLSAVKPVGFKQDGTVIFALIGGNDGNDQAMIGEVNRDDYQSAWYNMNLEGYLFQDFDMNGIVITKDMNVSWNNRGRIGYAD